MIGQIGYIRPEVAAQFEALESSVVLIIETDELIKRASNQVTCSPLPKHPGIARDLALLVDKSGPAGDIQSIIHRMAGEFLETCVLFDVYSGKQIEENMKSVAFDLYFRSPDRTLSDSDIKTSMNRVVETLSKELSAQLR
jgi:phenylalanyl-tRNA synthetase beta chain